jgi:hypothetical protein
VRIINVYSGVIDQLLIRYSAADIGEEREYNGTVHQLFIGFEKTCD